MNEYKTYVLPATFEAKEETFDFIMSWIGSTRAKMLKNLRTTFPKDHSEIVNRVAYQMTIQELLPHLSNMNNIAEFESWKMALMRSHQPKKKKEKKVIEKKLSEALDQSKKTNGNVKHFADEILDCRILGQEKQKSGEALINAAAWRLGTVSVGQTMVFTCKTKEVAGIIAQSMTTIFDTCDIGWGYTTDGTRGYTCRTAGTEVFISRLA